MLVVVARVLYSIKRVTIEYSRNGSNEDGVCVCVVLVWAPVASVERHVDCTGRQPIWAPDTRHR